MGKCFSKPKKVDDGKIRLKDFELLRSVGRGAFGKVRIVRRKNDKQILYAMKYINKEKCIAQNAVKNTLFERNLLEQIEHPLIVNLRFAFQDEENMFMVIDLMLGGDLKYHLQKQGPFTQDMVRFFAIEISCALMYLHRQGIVHRDIKPDNLLLDANGHVHLTDFNVAAFLPNEGRQLRSFSGTLSYMAPEVIGKQGYREGPDWWSLGVVLFELLFGKRPFRAYSSKELAARITHGSYQFPSAASRVEKDLLDLIVRLLEKDPTRRLGTGEIGLQRLKAHPVMRGVDWDAVYRKELQPPFLPDPDRPNFDAMFEAEDILLEDNPLKPNRSRSSHVETADPNMLMIAMQYKDYNYQLRDPAEPQEGSTEQLRHQSGILEEEKCEVGLDSVASRTLTMISDQEADQRQSDFLLKSIQKAESDCKLLDT